VTVELAAAERFVLGSARLLDRHRLAVMLADAPVAHALDALRPYRNPGGGFGHALEPDVRGPESEPASTLHALEVLEELGALGDPMVGAAGSWIAGVADPDGGVPFVMADAAAHPHAPWMVPSDGGSHLTFALAGQLWTARGARGSQAGTGEPPAASAGGGDRDDSERWLATATRWCWERLERADELSAYFVKFALGFLDRVPDEERARERIEALGARLDADGSMAVAGGTANERLGPLTLSERPGRRSRALFSEAQIAAELDALERAQLDDGGWTFDWLAWSPGQAVEWRGAVTLRALGTLRAHGRI
jgi:hypothetical protein